MHVTMSPRNDIEISNEIIHVIQERKDLEIKEFKLDVRHGIVTLDGTMNNEEEIYSVLKIVKIVPGVTRIDNELKVIRH